MISNKMKDEEATAKLRAIAAAASYEEEDVGYFESGHVEESPRPQQTPLANDSRVRCTNCQLVPITAADVAQQLAHGHPEVKPEVKQDQQAKPVRCHECFTYFDTPKERHDHLIERHGYIQGKARKDSFDASSNAEQNGQQSPNTMEFRHWRSSSGFPVFRGVIRRQ